MADTPYIENVVYDATLPLMDREQIDMLLMVDEDEGEDSTSLAEELFGLYESESLQKLANLEAICRERDGLALRKLVHFIAGSAGNLGLARMCAFYCGIEQAIDEGRLEDYDTCERLIRQEFERSCQLFREEFGLKVN